MVLFESFFFLEREKVGGEKRARAIFVLVSGCLFLSQIDTLGVFI